MLVLLSVITASAKPRTADQMKRIAQNTIQRKSLARNSAKKGAAQLKTLLRTEDLQVMGYEGGGYVVVAADDLLPEVLGYSDSKFSETGNPAFGWWLQSVRKAARMVVKTGVPNKTIKPDPTLYAESVAPLITSKWDQQTPYNDLCPGGASGKTMTGCVATAMAQVMYFWRYPLHGTGSKTIYYPFEDTHGQQLTVDFSQATYDWDNMIDDYSGSYTPQEAAAVATLMYHCGVASSMQYGVDGSGTYNSEAAAALKNNFGFPASVRYVERSQYEEADWMQMVYTDISNRQPIIYTGSDYSYGGHCFVLDGYNADGLVHINWGWSGTSDGFYNIDLLNPTGFQFETYQTMVTGIKSGNSNELIELNVTTNGAGTLQQQIPAEKQYLVSRLTVSGNINSTDLKYLRRLAGRDEKGRSTRGQLAYVDLTGATIQAGGEPFIIDGTTQLTTRDNELPERAFYDCEGLKTIKLPGSIKAVGNGAFAMCLAIEELTMPESGDNFVRDGDFILSKDRKAVVQVLPSATGRLDIPKGVTRINDYALAGCSKLTRLSVPSTLESMGTRALYFDFGLVELRSYTKNVPTLGANVFDEINLSRCKLYVPGGSKAKYKVAPQWKDFIGSYKLGWSTTITYDNIIEFGTTLTARNAIREYGDENPTFGYKIEGDAPAGVPELTCAATQQSPVGTYDIVISRGTVGDELVEFVNGKLTILPAPLTVKAEDCTRPYGEDNPEFKLAYEGFKNNEDETVFIVKPAATTTATKWSAPGTYDITPGGGEATNYEMEYVDGKLTVTATDAIISAIVAGGEAFDVYSADGQLVARSVKSFANLKPGTYVVKGMKVTIRK